MEAGESFEVRLRADKYALDPSGKNRADRALKVLVKPTNVAYGIGRHT